MEMEDIKSTSTRPLKNKITEALLRWYSKASWGRELQIAYGATASVIE
jgi:hypothetical protein